jgi:hypothetical protein
VRAREIQRARRARAHELGVDGTGVAPAGKSTPASGFARSVSATRSTARSARLGAGHRSSCMGRGGYAGTPRLRISTGEVAGGALAALSSPPSEEFPHALALVPRAAFLCVLALPAVRAGRRARVWCRRRRACSCASSRGRVERVRAQLRAAPAGEELASYETCCSILDSMGWDPASEQPRPTDARPRARRLPRRRVQPRGQRPSSRRRRARHVPLSTPSSRGPRAERAPRRLHGRLDDPGYAASATPSPLLAAAAAGLASVHVDLAAIIATFRPLIDTGRGRGAGARPAAQEQMPFDVGRCWSRR